MKNNIINILVALITICISQIAQAQIKTSIDLGNPYLNQAKSIHKTHKEYKKQLKDSLKQIKKLNKRYDFKMDSLMRQLEKEANQHTGMSMPSIDTLSDILSDTTKIADRFTENFNDRINNKAGSYIPKDSTDTLYQIKSPTDFEISNVDGRANHLQHPNLAKDTLGIVMQNALIKTGEDMVMNTKEFQTLNTGSESNDYSHLLNQKQSIERTQKELKEASKQKNLKKKMTSMAKAHIIQNSVKIQQVQSKMGDMKKKFSYIPNSTDLSAAVKRNSLKGTPFLKRLFTGGNINIKGTKPLVLDLSPQIGYRINKVFQAGITGIYRNQFKKDSTSADEVYGYSVFVDHKFYKSFFGYFETERISKVEMQNDQKVRSWNQTILIGVGREMSLTRWLDMQLIITVNLLHSHQNDVHGSPFVFKTGFRIKK